MKTIISTHAPAWGATWSRRARCPSARNFYSRPRVGGDFRSEHSVLGQGISTHAPAWGATAIFHKHQAGV